MYNFDKIQIFQGLLQVKSDGECLKDIGRGDNKHSRTGFDYFGYYCDNFDESIDSLEEAIKKVAFDDNDAFNATIINAYEKCKEKRFLQFDNELGKLEHNAANNISDVVDENLDLYEKLLEVEDSLKDKRNSSQMLELIDKFKTFFIKHCERSAFVVNSAQKLYNERISEKRFSEKVNMVEKALKKSEKLNKKMTQLQAFDQFLSNENEKTSNESIFADSIRRRSEISDETQQQSVFDINSPS